MVINSCVDNCTEKLTHTKIKCSEKQSKFYLLNPQKHVVAKIKVDDCIYKSGHNDLCCDFILVCENNPAAIFVELKGSDIAHAIRQIIATISAEKCGVDAGFSKFAVIVTSKTIKEDTVIKGLKNQLRVNRIKLQQGNSPLEINLAEFSFHKNIKY